MLQATVAPIARVSQPRMDRTLGILGYVALILYGSLYPFSGWTPSPDAFAFLFRSLGERRHSNERSEQDR